MSNHFHRFRFTKPDLSNYTYYDVSNRNISYSDLEYKQIEKMNEEFWSKWVYLKENNTVYIYRFAINYLAMVITFRKVKDDYIINGLFTEKKLSPRLIDEQLIFTEFSIADAALSISDNSSVRWSYWKKIMEFYELNNIQYI